MFVEMAERFQEWPARIVDGFEPEINMVFEGAQGVMLDETHGLAPHNTWTNTTFENADTLLDEASMKMFDRVRIGCLRSYYYPPWRRAVSNRESTLENTRATQQQPWIPRDVSCLGLLILA